MGLHGRGLRAEPPLPDVIPALQGQNGEKTNNGIHYRLQLLYSNGGCRGGRGARAGLTPPSPPQGYAPSRTSTCASSTPCPSR